jgi:hypothetical protein
MTDKELLEKAAKAVGYVEWDWLASDGNLNVYNKEGRQEAWNPLTDDGDALRLAVKLNMDIVFDFDRVMVVFGDADAACITEYFYELPEPTDRYAATRKAIVRAAAAIGEQL